MDDGASTLIAGFLLLVLVCAVAYGGVCGVYFFNNSQVTITEGNKVIYEGRRICISVGSAGMKTKLDIFKPYSCSILKKSYVADDITVRPM